MLQTLAIIQRTHDPRRVVTLARVQERELRRWLYDTEPAEGSDLLSSSLQAEADRIEQAFDIKVELVTVGNWQVDERGRAMAAAVGEALTNAARHSGVDLVSVYAEATDRMVDVWISDLGVGFDAREVPDDRHGIAESIVGRLERQGGQASIISNLGEGTEVHLQLELES